MKHIVENGQRYAIRNGQRIAVETLNPVKGVDKSQRKQFKVEWVKLPLYWFETLRRAKRISTYQLAHIILFEAFKCERICKEIILSSEVTKMDRTTRFKAVRELVELGLIRVEQKGNQALRVSMIYYFREKEKEEKRTCVSGGQRRVSGRQRGAGG